MRARTSATVSAVALALALATTVSACSTAAPDAAEEHRSPVAAAASDTDALLEELGLAGMSGREIVGTLERSTERRPLALSASVREDHVLVGNGTHEVAVALPAEEFYVSVAPFVDQTHECYHHSLATCQGELAGQEMSVLVTGDDGQVLVDETVTTGSNGFTGFWLPRGIEDGTLEVSSDGHLGSVPLATTPGSPTCITTLRLEPAQA